MYREVVTKIPEIYDYTAQNESLDKIEYLFNINILKKIQSGDLDKNDPLFFVFKNIQQLYLKNTSGKIVDLLNEAIPKLYGNTVKFDPNFFIARGVVPNLSDAKFSEKARNRVASNFFDSVLNKHNGDIALFCSEIDCYSLQQKLDHLYTTKGKKTRFNIR